MATILGRWPLRNGDRSPSPTGSASTTRCAAASRPSFCGGWPRRRPARCARRPRLGTPSRCAGWPLRRPWRTGAGCVGTPSRAPMPVPSPSVLPPSARAYRPELVARVAAHVRRHVVELRADVLVARRHPPLAERARQHLAPADRLAEDAAHRRLAQRLGRDSSKGC